MPESSLQIQTLHFTFNYPFSSMDRKQFGCHQSNKFVACTIELLLNMTCKCILLDVHLSWFLQASKQICANIMTFVHNVPFCNRDKDIICVVLDYLLNLLVSMRDQCRHS